MTIYQNNNQTYLKKKEVEPVDTVLKNIYQSNTYRRDLSWPHFDDDIRVQEIERPTVLHTRVATPSSNLEHQPRFESSIPYMGVWYIYKDTEQPQEKETSWNE